MVLLNDIPPLALVYHLIFEPETEIVCFFPAQIAVLVDALGAAGHSEEFISYETDVIALLHVPEVTST